MVEHTRGGVVEKRVAAQDWDEFMTFHVTEDELQGLHR
jgi:hypothetical protein